MNKLQATKNDRIMCQNYEEKSGMRLVNSNCQSINTSSLAHNKENVQLGEKRKKAEVAVKNRPTGRVATISHKKQQEREVFTTFNPQANKSSQSSLATSQQHPKTILQIDIDLGDRTELVRVSIDDSPEVIAGAFIKQHRLPALLLPRLSALISEGLGRVVQKSRQMSSGTI